MYHYAVCLENGWGVQKDMKKVFMFLISFLFTLSL